MAKRGFLRVSEGQDANPVRHEICAPATRQSEQSRELRADGYAVIVPTMAGQTKRAIGDQDVQGLKCLRKISPLLSRLRKVGTERDRAGNRLLFMDHSCALILMALFSPMIRSLRDPQRACALDKVRKRLRVSRASMGSLSASVAIFDPAQLKEIAAELSWTPNAKGKHLFGLPAAHALRGPERQGCANRRHLGEPQGRCR
jgi:hypothetical protein